MVLVVGSNSMGALGTQEWRRGNRRRGGGRRRRNSEFLITDSERLGARVYCDPSCPSSKLMNCIVRFSHCVCSSLNTLQKAEDLLLNYWIEADSRQIDTLVASVEIHLISATHVRHGRLRARCICECSEQQDRNLASHGNSQYSSSLELYIHAHPRHWTKLSSQGEFRPGRLSSVATYDLI